MKFIKRSIRLLLLSFAGLVILCLTAGSLVAWDNLRLPRSSEFAEKLSQMEKARIIEARHLRQKVGNEIMPRWGLAQIPVILYNEKYAFLIGVSAPPDNGWKTVRTNQQCGTVWEVVPDDDYLGEPYYRQALSPGITPQAFTVMVGENYVATLTTLEYFPIILHRQLQDSVPAFIEPFIPYRFYINALMNSSDQFISLILHEAAHAYQGISAPDRLIAGEQANFDLEKVYPWDDTNLRDDWQSELDMLALALRAKSNEEARFFAKEFLLIRQSRRQSAKLSAELIEFERHREWVEGIGRYAEISVYRLAHERMDYSPVQEILNDPRFFSYEKYDRRWEREIDQMKRMADDWGEGRFYYTGMAQAVLLDRLAPGWQSQLFEPGVWLEDLLAQALSKTNGWKQDVK